MLKCEAEYKSSNYGGLSNVKRETAKYLGNMDIKVKRKEFSVTVLLQERSRNE